MAIGRMQMNRQLYAEGTGILQASQAKDMLQRVAPRGEFLAYINPEEAGILRALGGAGEDINGTGIPSFFVKKAFKSVTKAVKKIASSPIGQIALAVAAPYAIGAFAPGFATLGGTGAFGAALRGGISNIGISALTGQKINPRNVLASAALSGGLQGLQTRFGGTTPTATDPGIARDSIFAQPGTEGTFTYSDMGDDIINLSPGSITPTGQIVSGTPVQNQLALDQLAKQSAVTTGSGEVAKQATRGYMDITKDLFSGDFTKMGSAATELGGKALKTIYTNKDGSVDKAAVLATLSAIPSYLDAKKAADEAGVGEFDEAAYNTERDKYMERYKANLPASSFGIQAAANGGRIGYAEGTKPSAEENTPSQEIINRQIQQIKQMGKMGSDVDTIKQITGASDGLIKQILGQANGGRIGYAEGSNLEQSMDEYLKALDAYTKEFGLKEGYSRAQNDYKYLFEKKANGGRIGYREGTPREGIVSLTDEDSGVVYRDPKTGEPLTIDEFLRRTAEDEADIQLLKEGEESGSQFISRPDDEDKELDYGASSITLPKKKTFRERTMEIAVPKQINRELEDKFENYLKKLVTGKKDGGRMGFMMGTEVPMRQNQGGITELDYRKTGGFVPVGVKERADDVPAMLSKNEFVFTADAVRGAGKGDINKGAKMMYAKMKALEGKVKKFKKTKKKKVKV
jgi:hypothetical protein